MLACLSQSVVWVGVRPGATWFGGSHRSGFFLKDSSVVRSSQRTSPGSAVVFPVVVAQLSPFPQLSARFRKGADCFNHFPGSFTSLGHPVCDCHCAGPAKKSSKGHAFAVRQPPDSSLVFPSSIFFTNFFTTLYHLSVTSLSLVSVATFRVPPIDHCQSLKPPVDQP